MVLVEGVVTGKVILGLLGPVETLAGAMEDPGFSVEVLEGVGVEILVAGPMVMCVMLEGSGGAVVDSLAGTMETMPVLAFAVVTAAGAVVTEIKKPDELFLIILMQTLAF